MPAVSPLAALMLNLLPAPRRGDESLFAPRADGEGPKGPAGLGFGVLPSEGGNIPMPVIGLNLDETKLSRMPNAAEPQAALGLTQYAQAAGRDYGAILEGIARKHPKLGAEAFKIIEGTGPGYLEFYHPEERDNPNPGVPTIEIRDKGLKGEHLERAIVGDMLHYLPEIDETYAGLKQRLIGALPGKEIEFARQRHANDGDPRPFEQWFDQVWSDAIIRGYLTPDANDEWRRSGMYTPDMQRVLGQMGDYLGIAPPPIQQDQESN